MQLCLIPPVTGFYAKPGGVTVERGRLFSGVGNSAAGPAITVPPEPDLAQKRIVTGGLWLP